LDNFASGSSVKKASTIRKIIFFTPFFISGIPLFNCDVKEILEKRGALPKSEIKRRHLLFKCL
jgi:hypothetical protein